jgi:predicted short-subunit dehydrogenase-like oxidoreductase (DUF2520 family)
MNVSIVGAGNVAWHLAKAFEKADVAISEVYARDIHKALALTETLYSAVAVNSLDFSKSPSSVFFICISDDAIAAVSSQLTVPSGSVIVHTSGAKPLAVFEEKKNMHFGVFYPLQTFTKGVNLDFETIPILIEADTDKTYSVLYPIAKSLSKNVRRVTSRERLVYHVSAVFSCNFVNHLWALSKEILESENQDFELLKSLIVETTQKMLDANHPADLQTGPAVRNDVQTINSHLEFLNDDEDLSGVYTALTESISDWHKLD